MILPESPDHELIGQMNKENVDVKERPVSVGSPYAHLGIGLPGGHARQEDDLHIYSYPKSRRRHSSVSSRCSSNQAEEDPNILLGIIRELVEETASWDSGEMFMDKNFENMIRTSKIETRGKFEEDVADSSASASRSFEGLSEGRSAEIDLALLGLDIFKNNSDTYFDENAIDDSANLVSYWEDDSASEPRFVTFISSYPPFFHPDPVFSGRPSDWHGNHGTPCHLWILVDRDSTFRFL